MAHNSGRFHCCWFTELLDQGNNVGNSQNLNSLSFHANDKTVLWLFELGYFVCVQVRFKSVPLTSVAWSPSHMGCWKTLWSNKFHRSTAAGYRNGWIVASWNISTVSPRSLACPAHTHSHTQREHLWRGEDHQKIQTKSQILNPTTNLLDLVFLHEGHELEKESRQAEQEVDELMDDEWPPGGNLELCVVVQHVAPSMFQWGLKGVFWQHCIYVLHRQVRRAQDVGCAVHLHDGQCTVTAGLEKTAIHIQSSDK